MSTKPVVFIGAGLAGEIIDVRDLVTASNAFSVRRHSKLTKRETHTAGSSMLSRIALTHVSVVPPSLFRTWNPVTPC